MTKVLESIHHFVWGLPALVLIIGVGIWLSCGTGFAQIRLLPRALRDFARKLRCRHDDESGVSPFQALCTALAATAGTGNLVGVAGAICIGGPGAIFWMWVCGLLGMATKFAEATLAVRWRVRENGEYLGGPMYMICRGMGAKWRPLAEIYCFFGVFAAFGVGNATQINAVIGAVDSVLESYGLAPGRGGDLLLGILLAALIGGVLLGGAGRIGRTAEKLVPLASAGYLALCLVVLFLRYDALPEALSAIVTGAFSPTAVTGGAIGSVFQALRVGCSRGVFTNEAGMGTASIAHASARVEHPVEQGLMGILEVFLDTIVMCTLTALVILVSGAQIPYGTDAGATLTQTAFSAVCGDWVGIFLALALGCFAIATVLGWGFYGIRCAQFLFGPGSARVFALAQTGVVILSAVLETGVVWLLAETVNGLMAIPNLIALACLSGDFCRLVTQYERKSGPVPVEVRNANFHQRKPLRALSHAKIPPHCGGSEGDGQAHLSSEHWSA